jgi:hypothetical protein
MFVLAKFTLRMMKISQGQHVDKLGHECQTSFQMLNEWNNRKLIQKLPPG